MAVSAARVEGVRASRQALPGGGLADFLDLSGEILPYPRQLGEIATFGEHL
jgi:hypothetical protein